MISLAVPLVGFCAWSGTGKTTLLGKLLPRLRDKGLRVGVVKHAHHDFDIDHPGKDSHTLRKAGASQMLIASRRRLAWIKEFDESHAEPPLAEALAGLDIDELDLVLVEGFKHESFPKIELIRRELGKPYLFPEDPNVIAVASDAPLAQNVRDLPLLDINDPEQIVTFVVDQVLGEKKQPDGAQP
jgi:molybdopterin-guanine dinucleotide biosynthesis protein MobB